MQSIPGVRCSIMIKRCTIAFLIALVCLIVSVTDAFCVSNILNIRRWTAPDHTRVVLDVSDDVTYTTTEGDRILSIVLANTAFPKKISNRYVIDKPAVNTIVLSPLQGNRVNVELRLGGDRVKTKVFKLGPIRDKKPHRVVIDIILPEVEKQQREERAQVKVQEKIQEQRKIIVIDPGHGGEDPGAVGRRGTKEKDIVLRIARQLRSVLRGHGYQAYLTREGDYYVSFKKRMKIAREYGADLFISIHTDAHRCKGARGTSVYCLSTGGASNEAARLLARNENLSDIVAGVANGETNGESDPITLNMLQTETINQSKIFGTTMLHDLKKVNRVKYKQVHEAPFRVLKLPDIPSILVEVAYISNPREELRLRQSSFRKDVAWAIASSVEHFLPLPPSVIARVKKQRYGGTITPNGKSIYHVVRRGEYLDKIAQEYDTTVRTLMRLNHLRSKNRIRVGQKLRVYSATEPGKTPTVPTQTYVVRRGDLLERIARRFDTSTGILMKLNNIRSPNRIFVGQRLKVPASLDGGDRKAAGKEKKKAVYVVRKGDILDAIARKHDISVATLMKLNTLKNKNRIYPGQKLRVSEVQDAATRKDPEGTAVADDTPETTVPRVQNATGSVNRKVAVTFPEQEKGKETPEVRVAHAEKAMRGDARGEGVPPQEKIGNCQKKEVSPAAHRAPAAPSGELRFATYVVKRGDMLERIARRYHTSPETLMALNGITRKNRIYINQSLKVPYAGEASASLSVPPKVQKYTVKRGDTLVKIAYRYGITVGTLLRLNHMRLNDRIYVGQRLDLPSEREYSIYVVKRGDFLEKIADNHHTTIALLRRLNNLRNKNYVYAGQRLRIPSTNASRTKPSF